MLVPQRIERLFEGDKVTRYEPRSLMNQLVKRVLTVRAWLAPVDRAGCMRDLGSNECDVLTIALHR